MAMPLVHCILPIRSSLLIIFIGAQTSIVQSLTYFEHLSEPMAELLHILSEQYDYPQLSGEVMRYVLSTECTVQSNGAIGS